ncbi:MAG: 5-dehydro-2-deoxygluconokinase [Verrucomicrobiota bacterium]
MSPPKVASIGEVLWDLLPSGPQLGGAPANLACHVRALGGDSSVISRVGDDALGRRARVHLGNRGVRLDGLETDPSAPTGTVEVELDSAGKPRFTILENTAWDQITCSPVALDLVSAADAVGFGTLAQRTPAAREALHRLLDASGAARLILCDINLRDPFHTPEVIEASLRAATALKLNETELPALAAQFHLAGGLEDCAESLAQRFALDTVILTLGAAGCRVWCDDVWTTEPGRNVPVVDTVGAGDSFTAAFLMGRLLGWSVPTTVRLATDIAAYVCTQSGATPELPDSLTGRFLKDVSREI